jgi:hypothetical protein
MCFVFIWEQTATSSPYNTNCLVFITEMKSVYSAVRTGSLNNAVCASSLKGPLLIERNNIHDYTTTQLGWKQINLSQSTTCRHTGEKRYACHHYWSWHYMQMRGRLHAPAYLHLTKNPFTHRTEGCVDPRVYLHVLEGDKKKLLPPATIWTPDHPVRSLIIRNFVLTSVGRRTDGT